MAGTEVETYAFQAEINQLLSLIINTFYKNKEVFLRELISNASDALDKIRHKSLTDSNILSIDSNLEIRIRPDKDNGLLIIEDTGIGMTKNELINNIGTIAKSGTKTFIEDLLQNGVNNQDIKNNLIGQFGVGFYSAYLVADKVVVVTKSNDDDEYIWESKAGGSFTITKSTEKTILRGTQIILHMKDDQKEYLETNKLQELIKKHNEFINFPILLEIEKEVEVSSEEIKNEIVEDDEEGKIEDVSSEELPKEKIKQKILERINTQKPIWTQPAEEITKEKYSAFYKSTFGDWEDNLAVKHFNVEGQLEFSGLLFIPKRAPFDLFAGAKKNNNIKLYVRRVFIMDNCEDLIPEYMSFVKGIIDSCDLPLNVSRETLQQNRIMKVMYKTIVKRVIELISELSDEDFKVFYNEFNKNIKLGIHEDSNNRNKLSEFLRFYSSKSSDEMISLDQYISRMKPDQKSIYYIIGESKKQVENSPFIEKLMKKGFEVLYMTDTIDEYMMQQLKDYKDKSFVSCTKNTQIDDDVLNEDITKDFEPLCKKFKDIGLDNLHDVKLSDRLTDSPCIIVTDQYGWSANMERIMKAQTLGNTNPMMAQYMSPKKILELNPFHPLIKELNELTKKDKVSKDMLIILYDGALLNSGFTLNDTSIFVRRLHNILKAGLSIQDDVETIKDHEDDTENKDEEVTQSIMEDID